MADTSLKDMLVVLPLLGTGLAVTFDVGYFYGIDIQYFTLFSLSEHINFALEAIPFVIGLTFFSMLVPVLFDFRKARRARASKEPTSGWKESTKPIRFTRRVCFGSC